MKGRSSQRGRLAGAPDEAAIAGLIGPERRHAGDDRVGGKRAEIAPVQAVWRVPVHEENFAVAQPPASFPDWHQETEPVAFQRMSVGVIVGNDGCAVSADRGTRQRENPLDERYAASQISALGEEF